MDKPLDDEYFDWLCNQVGSAQHHQDPSTAYWRLLRLLYIKEFVWFVPNDDNRAEDGRDLRREFLKERRIRKTPPGWLQLSCGLLELLIALSRRLAFEGEGEPSLWFWQLIDNLGLYDYRDSARYSEAQVNEILDEFIWRTYEPNGHGGLFPLADPHEDQREVELWYQMSAYLLERY